MIAPNTLPQRSGSMDDPIPARMLNEFTYCPRLSYLEWVQGEFAPSADTLDGDHQHRRVNRPSGRLPDEDDPKEDCPPVRSLQLSAPDLGMVAVIDLAEIDTDPFDGKSLVTPVEYKRGAVPNTPEQSWEADRVQLCAQGLILRENGYHCEDGILYYASSKTRVRVPFDPTLCRFVTDQLHKMRQMAGSDSIPEPLESSPKCPRCSLVGICLPDETRILADQANSRGDAASRPEKLQRPIIPTKNDKRPLYVQEHGSYVSKKGYCLEVRDRKDDTKGKKVQLADVSHVCLFGGVQASTQAIGSLCDESIPIAYFSYGGYFRGMTTGLPSKNVDLRIRQYASANDPEFANAIARSLVAGKIENQRTLLRRNHDSPPTQVLDDLREYRTNATRCESNASLLGIEGIAAKAYFGEFAGMLKSKSGGASIADESGESVFQFDFTRRNRRPPVDPVNALLSYGYAILTKDLSVAAWIVGLDPFLGFYHRPKYGKPALALDLMEEFRPLIVDSVVITVINTGVLSPSDFVTRGQAVALTSNGRKKFLQAYERRMETQITHPIFGYRITYRRTLEVQTRLLSRVLMGEIDKYQPFTTR